MRENGKKHESHVKKVNKDLCMSVTLFPSFPDWAPKSFGFLKEKSLFSGTALLLNVSRGSGSCHCDGDLLQRRRLFLPPAPCHCSAPWT